MKTKRKKMIVLFSTFCMLYTLAAGCSSSSTPATKTASDKVSAEELSDTPSADDAKDMEKPEKNTEGKWHVLDPEVAAAVDADFVGTIWHIAESAFSIAETKMQILDDGSLSSSSPSSNADIPDSQLVHVVVDDDTHFYMRTIYNNGKSYEDAEAEFQDLKEHISVEMKGKFENDVFYATEIRIIKIP